MVAILHNSRISNNASFLSSPDAISSSRHPLKSDSESQDTLLQSRILLVDDCDVTRTIIKAKLKKVGFRVFEAASGREALKSIDEVKPDLILLDVVMEDIDGLETCKRLKQSEHFQETPIIFLSGKAEKENVIDGLQAGAADYIAKPFDAGEAIARIKTHLKIRKLHLEKEKSNRELSKANASKDKLLAVTSHDLRNPLSAIRGLTEYLLSQNFGEINENQKEMLTQILDASDGMLDLVSDLLSLSILEDGECKLKLGSNNMAGLLQQVIKLSTPTADKKMICLKYEEKGNIPNAPYDENLVRRVLQNLIGNAIKFSPTHTMVTAHLKKQAEYIVVEIKDHGPGIPASEQDQLFKDYGTTSVKGTAGETSTGLGLSICKKIVEAHGGEIWMNNRNQEGACFAFKLPIDLQP